MTQTTRTAGALRRTADAMLFGSSARTVLLRLPAPAITGDPDEQLGLATPQFQDIEVAPVVFRTAVDQAAKNDSGRRDLIISATTVQTLTGAMEFASANVLFASAFGVLVDDVLLAIVAVADLEAGGDVYAYRLTLRQPIEEAP